LQQTNGSLRFPFYSYNKRPEFFLPFYVSSVSCICIYIYICLYVYIHKWANGQQIKENRLGFRFCLKRQLICRYIRYIYKYIFPYAANKRSCRFPLVPFSIYLYIYMPPFQTEKGSPGDFPWSIYRLLIVQTEVFRLSVCWRRNKQKLSVCKRTKRTFLSMPVCICMSMVHVYVHRAWCMSMLWSMSMSMVHVHVHGACLCPWCMSMSMMHVHVHGACPCPWCMPNPWCASM
jgi:hypothetical protein